MEKKNLNALYIDALYSHLIRQGYSEYQAEVECRRRLQQMSEQ